MIVFSVVLALATISLSGGTTGNAFAVTLAAIVSVAATLYYLKLDLGLGIAMGVILFLMCAGASEMVHRLGIGASLAWALGIFAVGWAIQFLGHKYEGVKPAFFDDVKQLLIGPIFVCAEGCFLLGARPELRRYIEDRVGPTVPRRDGRAIPILDGEPRF